VFLNEYYQLQGKIMSNLLTDLKDEITIEKFVQLEAAYDSQGIRYVRWSTKRFIEEQAALYAQGRKSLEYVNNLRIIAKMEPIEIWIDKNGKNRSDNDFTVTEADGIKNKSQHQFGNAVDYVILTKYKDPTWDYIKYCEEYRALRDIGKALGFNCGGSWLKLPNGKDSPYIKVNLGWDPPHIQIG
jgi:hypothetical protein